MPWQKNYDANEVVEKAMMTFWRQGYEATSIDDLVEATGINRGSMYHAFSGKRALFLQALRHYDEIYRATHLERIAAENEPRDAIIAVFEVAARRPKKGTPLGCLLVNTALELSPHDPEIRRFVDSSLRAVERFFYARIEAAKQSGAIQKALDSRATARMLLGLLLGLRVLVRANAPRSTIDTITSQAGEILA